jgi:hypothetical protein
MCLYINNWKGTVASSFRSEIILTLKSVQILYVQANLSLFHPQDWDSRLAEIILIVITTLLVAY